MKIIIKKIMLPQALQVGIILFCASCADLQKPVHRPIETSQIDESQFPVYANWLKESAENPLDYIVEKCRNHQIVIIGEPHYKKEYCELFKNALPEVYSKAGVIVVALEVCNAEDKDKIARLVEGDEYDLGLAYEIARSENWGLWGYAEYWDILKAVWKLNKNLPHGRIPMRVVGIDKKMDYQLYALWQGDQLTDSDLIEKAKNQPDVLTRDEWLTENVEKATLHQGLKGIVLIGFNHSFTNYAQPRLDKEKSELIGVWPRMGYMLYQKYKDKIFQIGLHLSHEDPGVIYKDYQGAEPTFDVFLEKVMALNENKPIGFDIANSPFADIRDSKSYYFYWEPEATFRNLCQGYIFLKPYKELTPCSWMDNFVTDEMFEKSKVYYEFAYKRTFKNSQEVNDFFRSEKPGL